MLEKDKAILRAREICETEADAVRWTAARIGDGFAGLAAAILDGPGNVICSGVGKSGIVAKKIAATLSSTGTPSFYLNPVNALHGDIGIVHTADILVAFSNSGETQELLDLVNVLKPRPMKVGAFTGSTESTLAAMSDFVVDVGVRREACPLGLAPTSSTTACLAVGDALAMVLMEARGFKPSDFRRLHPGGSLGRMLSLKVGDIMRTGDRLPLVSAGSSLADAMRVMSEKEAIGVALVTDEMGRLAGIVTDGDLRRIFLKDPACTGAPVAAVMSRCPKSVEASSPALEALRIMEVKGITSLVIVDSLTKPVGIIHLHDILGRGKFSI